MSNVAIKKTPASTDLHVEISIIFLPQNPVMMYSSFMPTKPNQWNSRLWWKKDLYSILGQFSFLQDQANFWQTWKGIVLLLCPSFSSNNVTCKTLTFPGISLNFWRSFVEQKTKETFCFAKQSSHKTHGIYSLVVRTDTSFIIYIVTLFSYCCLVTASASRVKGPDLSLFCRDSGSIQDRSLSLLLFQNTNIY